MTARAPMEGPAARAALPDPGAYSAVVSRLAGDDTAFDALALVADDGHLVSGRTLTVAGHGTAAVLELPDGLEDSATLRDVVAWLGAVPCDVVPCDPVPCDPVPCGAEPGDAGQQGTVSPGVVALGVFPFDRRAPAFLVVPSIAWCRQADGTMWRVTVSGGDARSFPTAVAPGVGTPGAAGDTQVATGAFPSVVERPAAADYAHAVAAALKEIGAGRLSKVVLSRALEVVCQVAPRPSELLDALWGRDPIFSPFSLPVRGGRLVGASPELIVSRIGATVTSHPFAGTVALGALGGDDPAGRLFASAKDRNEHRLLVDELAGALRPWCSQLDVPSVPSVVPLRSDARLGSLIRGTLRPIAWSSSLGTRHSAPSALDLVALLHPTPAVGGVPRPEALEVISLLEAEPRGYWAGLAGWVDADGNGEWVLAIRSAILDGRRATLRAGAGIVEGSDPTAELAETTIKLAPVLDALLAHLPGPA